MRETTAPTRSLPRVEEREVEIVSLRRIVIRRFIRHRLAVIGLGVIGFLLFFAYLGPFIAPYSADPHGPVEDLSPRLLDDVLDPGGAFGVPWDADRPGDDAEPEESAVQRGCALGWGRLAASDLPPHRSELAVSAVRVDDAWRGG